MAATVAKTQGLPKGDIDPRKQFEEWLKSLKVRKGLRDKMKQFKIDSMLALQAIDTQNQQIIKDLTNKMGLSTTQRLKFQLILKKVPRETRKSKMDSFIYPEEQKAIISMQQKLKQIEQSMSDIQEAKKRIAMEIEQCTNSIIAGYDEIITAVTARKEQLLQKLQEISDTKMVGLDQAYQEMKQQSIMTAQHMSSCCELVNKKVDLHKLDQRRDDVLNTAKEVDKLQIMDKDINHEMIEVTFDFDKELLLKCISKCGDFQIKALTVSHSKPTIDHDQFIKKKQIQGNMEIVDKQMIGNHLEIQAKEQVIDKKNRHQIQETMKVTEQQTNTASGNKLPEMTEMEESRSLSPLPSLDQHPIHILLKEYILKIL